MLNRWHIACEFILLSGFRTHKNITIEEVRETLVCPFLAVKVFCRCNQPLVKPFMLHVLELCSPLEFRRENFPIRM